MEAQRGEDGPGAAVIQFTGGLSIKSSNLAGVAKLWGICLFDVRISRHVKPGEKT